jgi:RNA polymerase sigma-70 factor (ECF subfamily)
MDGRDFQEETVLAAVKPLKAVESSANTENSSWPVAREQVADGTLEELFNQHHDRILRTAYRVTGTAEDAEDVLQTIFLRVARGQESAMAADNPEAYFARAAINASLDLLRSRKRTRAVAMDDAVNSASVASFVSKANPAADQEDRELRKLVREAVAKLGNTAGQMFALRYFEGLGNAEIAGVMNTSPLVVGVTLHRARVRMRKEIGKYLKTGATG